MKADFRWEAEVVVGTFEVTNGLNEGCDETVRKHTGSDGGLADRVVGLLNDCAGGATESSDTTDPAVY